MPTSSRAHAEHFDSYEQQARAATLGMWVFLGTELLLFGGLFAAYAVYRTLLPRVFAEGSHHLLLWAGTTNTFVLITSSLFVALAVHFARHGMRRAITVALALAIVLGFAFLGIKAVEYGTEFREGFHPRTSMFFTIYFLSTGLHALHVSVGLCVLGWLARKARRREFAPDAHTSLELGGMYWHLVDLIWIFLYPLLYLV